jgi:hypothetical protein
MVAGLDDGLADGLPDQLGVTGVVGFDLELVVEVQDKLGAPRDESLGLQIGIAEERLLHDNPTHGLVDGVEGGVTSTAIVNW